MTTPPSIAKVASTLTLEYAGLTVRVRAGREGEQVAIHDPQGAFLVSDATPADLAITVREGDPREMNPPPVPEETKAWVQRDRSDGRLEIFFYGRRYAGVVEPFIALVVDRECREASVIYQPTRGQEGTITFGFPVEEFLVSRLLSVRGGCILHACTVLDGGQANIFVGHTGAGKSTIAEIAESCGATVLSDDRTIVRVRDGAPLAFGTPWHGSYRRGHPRGAPIHALFLLVQDRENRVEAFDGKAAFGELFVRVVLPSSTPSDTLPSIETLGAVVDRCPVGALHFLPEQAAYLLARDWVPGAVLPYA